MSIGFKDVLIALLLIALIVLVIFMIILVSHLTDTVKKTNFILDEGMDAAVAMADKVTGTVDGVRAKKDAVAGLAYKVIDPVAGLFDRFRR